MADLPGEPGWYRLTGHGWERVPDEVLEHLRNIVTWAALWDATDNHDKNRAVYEQVLPYVLELGGTDITERLAGELIGDVSGWRPTGVQPIGWQGAAQHTYTTACDGFHEPGPCPRPQWPYTDIVHA